MDKMDKNGSAIVFFAIAILIIGIGGFYMINRQFRYNEEDKMYTNNSNNTNQLKKIDNNKNYIYYTDEDIISEEDELSFKNIKFNFESEDAKKLEEDLNDKMDKYRKKINKGEEINEMSSIDYETITTSNNISLTVMEYSFTKDEGKDSDNVSYYVFDLKNGKLLSNEDIMKKENISKKNIEDTIKKYIKDDENVDVDKTLKNDYYLTYAKNGKVVLNFIVNSNELNYNVSIDMK